MTCKKIYFPILLITMISCNNENNSTSAGHDHSQQQQANSQYISFEVVDEHRFWSWVDPDNPPEHTEQDFLHALEPEDVDFFIDRLKNAEKQIQKKKSELPPDQYLEFTFLTETFLGTLYGRKFQQSGFVDAETMDSTLNYLEKSVVKIDSLIEFDQSYKTDKVGPELNLLGMRCYKNAGPECLDEHLSALEKYKKTPFGPFPEWTSTRILNRMASFMANNNDEELKERFLEEVNLISDQDNLTGFTAHLTLARVYLGAGEIEDMKKHLDELSKNKPKTLPTDLQMRLERLEQAYQHQIDEHQN